ncbi:MAG: putative low-affinity inorganic phosphate transporter [Chthonomonadaceae bacterium]|nr:putative low-affinity inorganic phosphate transporter [Chthonomonadaceae bacterium]
MFLVTLIVVCALAFDFINGFHDTANAIATVVSTRVLSPRAAILMAAGLNLLGALCFTKVAETIAKGLVTGATSQVILAAILGAIVWNLATWYFGIPSSSSHALVGGLVGAAWIHGGRQTILWTGVLDKVILPLVLSPLAGFVIGFVVMALITVLFANAQAAKTGRVFRSLQVVSSAIMSFAHGSNDAQKSMGIIALALTTLSAHPLAKAPVPLWVKLACAVAMAAGTSMGGWRIIKTMGHKIIRLEPVSGFAAETTASLIILYATLTGKTVSTTHVISGSIFGVGSAKRFSAVRWSVAQTMLIAWTLTIPASATVAALCYLGIRLLGVH